MKEQMFSGLSDTTQDLNAARAQNKTYAQRRDAFRNLLGELKNVPAKKQIKALRQFIFDDNDIDTFQASELMQIFTAFRERRSFADMVRMVDISCNKEFTRSTIVRESYIVACNHTHQYNKAIEQGEALLASAPSEIGRGEIYGGFGKAWLKKHEVALAYSRICHDTDALQTTVNTLQQEYIHNFPDDKKCLKARENAAYALQQSKDNYEAGFLINFEYYPGINTVYRMLELEDFEGARNLSRMVYLATLRDGARESMDSWCAATHVEAACVMGGTPQEVLAAATQFIKSAPEPWQVEKLCEILSSMKSVTANYVAEGHLYGMAIEAVKKGVPVYMSGPASLSEAFNQGVGCPITRSLLNASFNYRGITSNFVGANFIPGNMQFGGQLPDHCVTRSDIREFQEVFSVPLSTLIGEGAAADYSEATLQEVYNLGDFLEIADKIVRRAFATDEDNLEYMQSPGHQQYDDRIKALIALSGTEGKAPGDSRTNISVIMGLGLGDCRHHAQVKQLLFDVWQKNQMNLWLKEAYSALKEKNIEGYYQAIEEFRQIECVELRTLDVTVKAPIAMQSKYYPECDEHGRPITSQDGALNVMEDHTLNVLLKRDKDSGQVKTLRFSDSFYQNQYSWKKMDIPVAGILFDNDGRMIIPASTIKAFDVSSGEAVDQPVYLKPTPYAGKRDAMPQDEIGQLLLLGMPVEKDFDLVTALVRPRPEKMAPIDKVRRWHKKEVVAQEHRAHKKSTRKGTDYGK